MFGNRNKNSDIESFVKKAQGGDTDAFALIYDEYFEHVYRYIYYRVEKSEVEDITAQVFMRAWDNLGKFKFKGVSFGAWLFKIAHNLIVDKYRAHRSIAEIPVDLVDERESSDPRYVTQGRLNQLVLKKALNELTDVYRQVVILKFINGFSNQEIAEILKRREGNVRILQFRALRELKGVLQKMGYGGDYP